MSERWRRVGIGVGVAGLFAGSVALAAAEQPPAAPGARAVDFTRDVLPLFTARCVACHGSNVQRNGLRLDRGALVLQGADSGPVVVPGKSAESELLRRVTSMDPKKVMPPGGGLPPAQVTLLRDWIDQGAVVPQETGGPERLKSNHWSFQPLARPPVPPVKQREWVRNPIDAFVLAKLEAKGLRPSPEADPVTLIRRVTLDLTGLPPTPEEVDAFLRESESERPKLSPGTDKTGQNRTSVTSPTPHAPPPTPYERLVDRLLASPHYGERWARRWLDQARYADSNGFTIDSARSIWKYRDWVIDAFNRNLPFDQFTIEQLAGDLLPSATTEQKIATGFHRNTLINEEGGTDPEQFRVESVVDRTNTTGSVFLGLTLGCAQCHTHKFDPLTQNEYYQFYAFFNNANEPTLSLPTPEQAREQERLKRDLAAAQKALADRDRQATSGASAGSAASLPTADWRVLDPAERHAAAGTTLTRLEDRSVLASGELPDNDVFDVSADAPGGPLTALRLEVLTHPSLPNGGPGWAKGNFLLTDLVVEADGKRVPLSATVADHAQKDYPVANAIDEDPKSGWAINVAAGQGKLNTDRTAVFLFREPVTGPVRLKVSLRQNHPNRRYLIGRFRLAVTAAEPSVAAVVLPTAVRRLLEIPEAERTSEQRATLAEELKKNDPERVLLTARVAELQAKLKTLEKGIVTTMVMEERATPRETHVQIRGDFLRLGAKVQPGVPAVLPPLPTGAKNPSRLDLARWLVSPENPLTPRVTVNRFWEALFGQGLVETENDFGKQGTLPSHPELLDWLAFTFSRPAASGGNDGEKERLRDRGTGLTGTAPSIGNDGERERGRDRGTNGSRALSISPSLNHSIVIDKPDPAASTDRSISPSLPLSIVKGQAAEASRQDGMGWDVKELLRMIVLSSTYRQSSKARPELQEVDPGNRLLARQNRVRLDAELVRDVGLAASGLLSRKIGGPSVFPPQPAGLDLFTQTKKNWTPSTGEDRYRRGMYTFMWRSSPYAMFATFDAPNGINSCTRRVRSNTPLQALMLANDQSVFEMAQALAARTLKEASSSDEARLRYAFRCCLAREPSAREATRLLEYYRAQVRRFQSAGPEAEATAPTARPEGVAPAEAAAWTSVARVLLNLDETVTRE